MAFKYREASRNHEVFHMLLGMIERKARLSAQWRSLHDAYAPLAEEHRQLGNGLVLDIILKWENGIRQSPVDEFIIHRYVLSATHRLMLYFVKLTRTQDFNLLPLMTERPAFRA